MRRRLELIVATKMTLVAGWWKLPGGIGGGEGGGGEGGGEGGGGEGGGVGGERRAERRLRRTQEQRVQGGEAHL